MGGFAWELSPPTCPKKLAFRVCCACPHVRFRCGGVTRLTDTAGQIVFLMYFTHDSVGRSLIIGSGGAEQYLGPWRDGEWMDIHARFDWISKCVHVSLNRDALDPSS